MNRISCNRAIEENLSTEKLKDFFQINLLLFMTKNDSTIKDYEIDPISQSA